MNYEEQKKIDSIKKTILSNAGPGAEIILSTDFGDNAAHIIPTNVLFMPKRKRMIIDTDEAHKDFFMIRTFGSDLQSHIEAISLYKHVKDMMQNNIDAITTSMPDIPYHANTNTIIALRRTTLRYINKDIAALNWIERTKRLERRAHYSQINLLELSATDALRVYCAAASAKAFHMHRRRVPQNVEYLIETMEQSNSKIAAKNVVERIKRTSREDCISSKEWETLINWAKQTIQQSTRWPHPEQIEYDQETIDKTVEEIRLAHQKKTTKKA